MNYELDKMKILRWYAGMRKFSALELLVGFWHYNFEWNLLIDEMQTKAKKECYNELIV